MRIRRFIALARFMHRQRVAGFVVPDEPHFDERGAEEFRRLLCAASSYLEFGSGGSTILASRLGVQTLSVESDPFFAERVRAKIPRAPCKVLSPHIGITKEWGYPVFGRPTPRRVRQWRSYVVSPFLELERSGGRFPDLILIDGRFRVASALECARRAREIGETVTLFFDDYEDRPYYHVVERFFGRPRMAGRAAIFELSADRPRIDRDQVEAFMPDVR